MLSGDKIQNVPKVGNLLQNYDNLNSIQLLNNRKENVSYLELVATKKRFKNSFRN